MEKPSRVRAGASLWLCACLITASVIAADFAAQPSVADQFRAMCQAYQEEQKAMQASGWKGPHGESIDSIKPVVRFIAKFVALAEQHPKDPATGENLAWLTTYFGKFDGMDKAEALLRRDWPGGDAYLDVIKEFKTAEQAFFEASGKAKTNEERRKAFEDHHPKPGKFTGRFLAIAEKHPQSPVAIQALAWVVQRGRSGADFDQALQILRHDYVKAAGLDDICGSLVSSTSAHSEDLLRAVAKENPSRSAQGNALLALARVLDRQADTVRSLHKSTDGPQFKLMESTYGKERLAAWRKIDPSSFEKEAEQLFEQLAQRYGDVSRYSGTLGEEAKAELFEKRSLVIGKMAPEIKGEDVDGKRFKLSDYCGKVVVIDFWGDW